MELAERWVTRVAVRLVLEKQKSVPSADGKEQSTTAVRRDEEGG